MAERLQKLIARAGLASRREAERWIRAGRVAVNGQVVRAPGTRADPGSDRIEVDGEGLCFPAAHTYLLLFKPARTITTASDDLGRETVLDLVEGVEARIYPVGRLDWDAEGVLLLTDDGDLTAALTHPSGGVGKTYRARVEGRMGPEVLRRLRRGVTLEDGPVTPRAVRLTGDGQLELTLTEGRNHLVKRLLAAVGHPVCALRRVRFATLELGDLRPGQWRSLEAQEVERLRAIAADARRRRLEKTS